jgi:ubiquinone/menaquinone biosynthesis C-methylase UbiE
MKRRARLGFVAASMLVLLPFSTAVAVQQDERPPKPRVYKGRVIAPVMTAQGGGAEWLERRDRDATEQPERVIDALKIPAGSTVADIGAGTGYFSLRMAKRIGPKGRVLATDVQPEMIRLLSDNAKKAGLKNVEPILCTETDAKLPPGKVDLALMVDVYHELQDPEGTMAQIRRALKPEGRLVLVEYRAEDPSVPIKPEHKTTLRQVRYEIEPMGFRLKEVFEFLPHQHVEVFVKDDVQGEDEIIDPADFPTVRKPGWAGVPPESHVEAGFVRLLDGDELTNWIGNSSAWRVRDGMLAGNAADLPEQQTELVTKDSWNDFELDLQWRLRDPDGSGAVRILGSPSLTVRLESGIPHEAGYPERITAARTGEVSSPGSTEPIIRSSDTAKALVFPGDWNRLTVRATGGQCLVAINAVRIAEFAIGPAERPRRLALVPGAGELELREIRVKRQGK